MFVVNAVKTAKPYFRIADTFYPLYQKLPNNNMSCTYCHNVPQEGQKLASFGNHTSCWNEYEKRKRNDKCTWCGTNDCKGFGDQYKCGDCKANNSDWSGFPGT